MKKNRKNDTTTPKPYGAPLRILTGIGCAVCVVCVLEYFFSVLSAGNCTGLDVAILICGLCVSLLPPLFAKSAEKRLPPQLFCFLRGFYTVCVLFYTVSFSVFVFAILGYAVDTPENEGKTAVLVYGCSVDGTEPRKMLSERLDAAYALLSENPDAVAIVSGAWDKGEEYSEAQVMAWYLQRKGISADRIFLDEEAESTKGNIRGFLRILKDENLTGCRKISVSSEFHIPRIVFLCGKYGLDCDFSSSRSKPFGNLFPSIVREYLAYVKMLVLNSYS